jgi:hypothetical protein
MNLKRLGTPRKLLSRIVGVQAEIRTRHPPYTGHLGFYVNLLCRCNAYLLYAYCFLVFVCACRTGRYCIVLQRCVVYDITICLCFGMEMPFLKFCDKLARFLRTMLYFVCNNLTGHVIPYDRRAFTVDPVRLQIYRTSLDFNCSFARRCYFRNTTSSD